MAENLDDGEFWLPPQFLDDNDDDETDSFPSNDDPLYLSSGDDSAFHFGSSTGVPSSDLSSPLSGSSETESDEDDHLHRVAELTHRVAHSTLHSHSTKPASGYASGSPQSTLCAFGCGKGSSEGSPNSVCNLCSAKATWDLLHAAAGEVERMRLSQQQQQQLPSYPYNTAATPDVSFYTQQALSHQKQFQIAQIQMLKQQQESVWGGKGVYQERQSNQMGARNRGGRSVRPLGLSPSAWPSLHAAKNQNKHHKNQNQQQQQYGPGMRAVFLTNPSTTRESAGTGVFLPRRVDAPETKKKPACATVFVPARVAQALNLNVDEMGGCLPQHLHRFNSSSNVEEHVVIPRLRSNYVHTSQQKRNMRPQPAALNINNEIKLPQEWTY
ncbi:hypothetical protein PIB30_060524 [Stylosanthes scabra]|uniref:Uncharacterized protein n=1 Tax=Stylosanthes scabra TaxID=79078 RepID=A0ABU6TKE4_9FABA|nr:hypothetical protein [Stylosanthes scabra]